MSYGLFVRHEQEPRATGQTIDGVRPLVDELTDEERLEGWVIKPVYPEWPSYPRPGIDFAKRVWTAVGIGVLLFLAFIALNILASLF